MRILLTNDDGINAKGIHALINELNTIAEIYVSAPDSERSGTGHSITVFDPIKAVEARIPGIKQGWLVGGTPVDSVKLAINRLIQAKIDLVVSGINHGSNLGTDVLYSGTVSAAAEGVILGCPSISVSLNSYRDDVDFRFAAEFTRRVILAVMPQGIEKTTLLNINIPVLAPEAIKGVRITKLGSRNYHNEFEERLDPRGNTYYWLGGQVVEEEQHEDSDVCAVDDGYISITPIHLDLTDYKLMEKYRKISTTYINSLLRGD
ncbi:MAG: 5'/3'-nucleotidase SurE [Syntrophomonadaceae bacterium]|nr:5'/3'-nucleotidase SurE [Syntrophomonadaceae bacterium]